MTSYILTIHVHTVLYMCIYIQIEPSYSVVVSEAIESLFSEVNGVPMSVLS